MKPYYISHIRTDDGLIINGQVIFNVYHKILAGIVGMQRIWACARSRKQAVIYKNPHTFENILFEIELS